MPVMTRPANSTENYICRETSSCKRTQCTKNSTFSISTVKNDTFYNIAVHHQNKYDFSKHVIQVHTRTDLAQCIAF